MQTGTWRIARASSTSITSKKYGPKAIGKCSAAYRDGLDTAAAIRKVCEVDKADFEKGYRRSLEELVKKMGGKPREKVHTFGELKEAVKEKPGDTDLKARLAEAYLRRDRGEGAQAGRASARPQTEASAGVVRVVPAGGAGRQQGQGTLLLEGAVDREHPDAKVVRALGKLYYDGGDLKKAAEMFELGRKAEPYESEWLTQLARVYARGRAARQAGRRYSRNWSRATATSWRAREALARLLASKDPADSEKYAREALEIDVADKEARQLLYKALEAQKKDAEAARLKKLLEK